MALNFEKYALEGNSFIRDLAENMGHPQETARAGIILRAVLHTLRERITLSESLNLISQLPVFLKGVYADNWKYSEKPIDVKTKEDFYSEVEIFQSLYGEKDFNWKLSTGHIVKTVFSTLGKYISQGEIEDIITESAKELKEVIL